MTLGKLVVTIGRVAEARREERIPTLEQIRHVIREMPTSTEIEVRNRALIAFTILTGVRDRATASLKLKHVDVQLRQVDQDARQVKTQCSKTFSGSGRIAPPPA
jgi:integrase/recombinase XerD